MTSKEVQIDCVLVENAAIDAFIDALTKWKSSKLAAATCGTLWDLVDEYTCARLAVSVFGDDNLADAMDSCADDLMRHHRYDVTEGRQLTRKEFDL